MISIGIDPSLTNCGISDGVTHKIIQTSPNDSVNPVQDLSDRCSKIASSVARFIGERENVGIVVIEAPMVGPGANHLYEVGWLMSSIYSYLPKNGVIEIAPSSLKKFATGKGNTPKGEMPLRIFKKWGVEFDKDLGQDKLFAYCLHRYGLAILSGEIVHVPSARRGKGGRKKAA